MTEISSMAEITASLSAGEITGRGQDVTRRESRTYFSLESSNIVRTRVSIFQPKEKKTHAILPRKKFYIIYKRESIKISLDCPLYVVDSFKFKSPHVDT